MRDENIDWVEVFDNIQWSPGTPAEVKEAFSFSKQIKSNTMFRAVNVSPNVKFGYVILWGEKLVPLDAEKFIFKGKVRRVAVFCGAGEVGNGSQSDLQKIIKLPIFGMDGAASPKNPTLATSCEYWPVVYIFVQTTNSSKYRSGEVPFAEEKLRYHFPEGVGDLCAISISLGGWITEYLNTAALIKGHFEKFFLMMTGNTGPAANPFPAAAAAAGAEVYYYHAQNDTTCPPALSVKQYDEFTKAGGKGYYVMYAVGGHGIAGWVITSFYPKDDCKIGQWRMWNQTTQTLTATSAKPEQSIYHLMTEGIEGDKLLLSQELKASVFQKVYQRADGTVYTEQEIAII